MTRTKKSGAERRSEPRTLLDVHIEGTLSVLSNFKLIDISNKGARIKISQRLAVGKVYKVRFSHDKSSKDQIMLNCEVVRSEYFETTFGKRGEPVSLYLVGFKFVKLNKSIIEQLKMFIVKEEILMKKKRIKKKSH